MVTNKITKVAQLLMLLICGLFFVGVMIFSDLTNIQDLLVGLGVLFLCTFFIALIRRKSFRRRPLDRRIKKIKRSSVKNFPVVEKIVIKEKAKPKKKKKVVPMTKYIGSTETKTYHVRACRFSKLIKPKFAIKENTRTYYNKNKFKACKSCNAGKN